jgi:Fic family protein
MRLERPTHRVVQSQPLLEIIIKAVIAHIYLAWIHPFGDGNGRTARLIEFLILLQAGIPSPAAHLLSNHYNFTRTEYYRQLALASSSGGKILPFVEYAVHGLVDGLKEQLAAIREQQWDVAWRNYVHERFRDKHTRSDKRRRDLVLDLSIKSEPVPIGEIMNLSPRIAREYAGKSIRTVRRDLSVLEELGLIERTSKDVRARREGILAFLP